jgi:hypothetical protein
MYNISSLYITHSGFFHYTCVSPKGMKIAQEEERGSTPLLRRSTPRSWMYVLRTIYSSATNWNLLRELLVLLPREDDL